MVTLGCARNEVDSEELAARLADDGWRITDDADDADVVLVNTCGFIEHAKQESIDTLLAASETSAKVVAVGCLAERYGRDLAGSLPEADAVLGFDHYPHIADRLRRILAGERIESHTPQDRRTLLPIAPARRSDAAVVVPGHGDTTTGSRATASGSGATRSRPRASDSTTASDDESFLEASGTPQHLRRILRRRLDSGPVAPLKLASGCDRRCAFCAIPSFRGAFISRPPDDLLQEAAWLAEQGVRELVLVSENSTSYGKDLGDPRLLEKLLPELARIPGIVRVRVSYLQPAELRPSLVEVIATTEGVAPYFDLSFQHASEPVLRRMRRFGSTERFCELLDTIRRANPDAGVRSNVIVGFPGETRSDVAELERFLTAARLDAIGVFSYSDEEGTEAATLPGKVRPDTIARRYARISTLADELAAQRAAERIGSTVEVLVESVADGVVEGRAAHQGPEDGTTTLEGPDRLLAQVRPGTLARAVVTDSEGVDLHAEIVEIASDPGSGAR